MVKFGLRGGPLLQGRGGWVIAVWPFYTQPPLPQPKSHHNMAFVDSRQISPKVSLMMRILDLNNLARLTNMSGKVCDVGKVT